MDSQRINIPKGNSNIELPIQLPSFLSKYVFDRPISQLILILLILIGCLLGNLIEVPALGALALFFTLASIYKFKSQSFAPAGKILLAAVIGFMCLAFASHAIPGFNNIEFLSHPGLNIEGTPKSVYLNFDKLLAGLGVIYGFSNNPNLYRLFKPKLFLKFFVATVSIVLVFIGLSGVGEFSNNFISTLFIFAVINLVFTVVTEEAFFRLMIQQELTNYLNSTVTIVCTAMIFGLLHFGGGIYFVIGATLAGVGYAWVYHSTNSFWASVLLHWLVNVFLAALFVINL